MQRLKSLLHSPRIAAAAILGLGGVATYLVNFPGAMEFDSFVQLLEGRDKSYAFWHPPVMSWLLGLFDTLPGGASAWFVGLDMAMAFGALAVVLQLPKRVSWASVVVLAFFLLLPQLALIQAAVWKDVLFADATALAAGLMAFAVARWSDERRRFLALAAAAVLLALAVLTRQNGAIVVPCLAAGLAFAIRRENGGWRLAGACSAGFIAAIALIAISADAALLTRWDGTPSTARLFNVLRLYDITGMVRRESGLPLTVFDREAPELSRLVRTKAVRLWSPLKNDTIEIPPIVNAIETVPPAVFTRQWQALVTRHPGLYLSVRTEVFRWTFQAPDVGQCHPFLAGIEPGAEPLDDFVIVPRMDPKDVALKHYGDFFLHHTPAFSHALFALLALATMMVTLRRRDPADIVIASLMGGALVFTASFFMLSIACDYRYLYVLDLTALAGGLYVAADWRDLLRTTGQQKGGPKAP